MKRFILFVLLSAFLWGCSATQVRQEFLGLSRKDVVASKTKKTLEFKMGPAECIEKIKSALAVMGAVITHEDRKKQFMVAVNFQNVFRSCIDTTQVGIAINAAGANKCLVEIASGNYDLADFVSKELSKIK